MCCISFCYLIIDVSVTKRDISTQLQQLREALAKVHANLKAMIQAIMQMSKDHLHKVYGSVKNILSKLLGNDKMKRDLGKGFVLGVWDLGSWVWNLESGIWKMS